MAKPNRASVPALEQSPSHLLHRAVQLALDLYAAEAEGGVATPRQYAVLCAVAADEGLSQTGLVRATGIDRSTLADMVSRMIGKGLVVRARSEADARANAVRLTEDGRAMLDQTAPLIARADERLLGMLAGKKREPFVTALRRLARAGEAALLPEPGEAAAEAEAEAEDAGAIAADAPKPKKAKREKAKAGKKKSGKHKSGKKKARRDDAAAMAEALQAEAHQAEADALTP